MRLVLVGVLGVVVITGCGETTTDRVTTTATGDASSSGGAITATAGASGESHATGGRGSGGDGQVLPGAGGQNFQGGGAGGANAGIVCGDTMCPAGAVCVVRNHAAPGMVYVCQSDTCWPEPLDCTCADPLCGGGAPFCSRVQDGVVYCDCLTC